MYICVKCSVIHYSTGWGTMRFKETNNLNGMIFWHQGKWSIQPCHQTSITEFFSVVKDVCVSTFIHIFVKHFCKSIHHLRHWDRNKIVRIKSHHFFVYPHWKPINKKLGMKYSTFTIQQILIGPEATVTKNKTDKFINSFVSILSTVSLTLHLGWLLIQ